MSHTCSLCHRLFYPLGPVVNCELCNQVICKFCTTPALQCKECQDLSTPLETSMDLDDLLENTTSSSSDETTVAFLDSLSSSGSFKNLVFSSSSSSLDQ